MSLLLALQGGGTTHNGAAALDGVGELAVAAVNENRASATLNGVGNLVVVARNENRASVAFAGVGDLFVDAVVSGTQLGSASFDGIGDLSINGDVVTPAPSGPTPAGRSSRDSRRKRYIMPDGLVVLATTDEVVHLLQSYSEPRQQPKKRARVVTTPQVVLEKRDVRFVPATDTVADTWKVVISEKFMYRSSPEADRLARERLAEEEAILVLLLS